jgi:hypothetical protein
MMGRQNNDQGHLFYEFRLDEAVPDDHLVLFGVRIVWRLGRGEISGAADNAAKGPLISVPLRATSPLD